MSIIDLKKNSNNDLPTYSLRRVFQEASIFSINIVQIVIGLLFLIPVSVMGFVFNWSFGLSGIPFYPLLNIAMWTVLFQVLAQNVISFYQAQQKYTITTLLQIGLFFLVTGLTILLIVGFTWGF